MADSKTFPCSDPAAIAEKIKAQTGFSIDPTKPTGEASADGVTLSWLIQPDGYIQITLVKKPFYIPESTVWDHVSAVFA